MREQIAIGMLVYIDISASTWKNSDDAEDYGQSSTLEPMWMRDAYLVVDAIYNSNPEPYIKAYKVLSKEGFAYIHPYARFRRIEDR